jgi:hypothetical protein
MFDLGFFVQKFLFPGFFVGIIISPIIFAVGVDWE